MGDALTTFKRDTRIYLLIPHKSSVCVLPDSSPSLERQYMDPWYMYTWIHAASDRTMHLWYSKRLFGLHIYIHLEYVNSMGCIEICSMSVGIIEWTDVQVHSLQYHAPSALHVLFVGGHLLMGWKSQNGHHLSGVVWSLSSSS